jgi:MoxR-like ATPase
LRTGSRDAHTPAFPVDTAHLSAKDETMYERMQRLLAALSTDLHEREEAVRLGLLAALAGESLFLLGPPGTGKSLIARRLQQAFRNARAFSYLMGRFSTPDEVFGPLSIRALREQDRYERSTTGYLPDADVVFLDEIWKASPPIQNALLTALNERRFRNGTEEISIPMKVFVGASNELPDEGDEAAAFWDRFIVRLVVEPVRDSESFSALLSDTADPYRSVVDDDIRITQLEFDRLRAALLAVIVPADVIALIAAIRASLERGDDESAPIYVSDRRWKHIASLLRMSAVLHGRDRVEPIDCAIIKACAWSAPADRPRVERVVAQELAARSGRSETTDALAARLSELRRSYQATASRVVHDERPRPVVYRDEYYRLKPAGRTADGVAASAADDQLLIWRGDMEEIQAGRTSEVDLFLYDPDGQLIGSQQSRVTLDGDWRLRVDDDEYEVETTLQRVTTEEKRAIGDDERAGLSGRIGTLLVDIDRHLDELLGEQALLEDTASRHLFVPASDAAVVLDAIRSTARRAGELRLLTIELAGTVTGA